MRCWILPLVFPPLLGIVLFLTLAPMPRVIISGPFMPKRLSNDGKKLYTVATTDAPKEFGAMQIWDVEAGRLWRTLFHSARLDSGDESNYIPAFTNDNRLIAFPSLSQDGLVHFYDEDTDHIWEKLTYLTFLFSSLQFHDNPRYLRWMGSGIPTSCNLDINTGKSDTYQQNRLLTDLELFLTHEDPNYRRISDAVLLDLEQRPFAKWEACYNYATSFGRRCLILATIENQRNLLRIWDCVSKSEATPTELARFGGEKTTVAFGSTSPDGNFVELLFFGKQGEPIGTKFLDLNSRQIQEIANLPIQTRAGTYPTPFSPNSRKFITFSFDRREMYMVDLPTAKVAWQKNAGAKREFWEWDDVFSPDGKYLVCENSRNRDDSWKEARDTETGELLAKIPMWNFEFAGSFVVSWHAEKKTQPTSFAWLWGWLPVSKSTGDLAVIDLKSGQIVQHLRGYEYEVFAASRAPTFATYQRVGSHFRTMIWDVPFERPWRWILIPPALLGVMFAGWVQWRSCRRVVSPPGQGSTPVAEPPTS